MYFVCDPEKNIFCKKKTCHLNGGRCTLTTDINYAKKPTPLGIDEGWYIGRTARYKEQKEKKENKDV